MPVHIAFELFPSQAEAVLFVKCTAGNIVIFIMLKSLFGSFICRNKELSRVISWPRMG